MSTRTLFNAGIGGVLLVAGAMVISRTSCGPGAAPRANPGRHFEAKKSGRHVKDGEEMSRMMGIAARDADPASVTRTRATRHAGGWYVLDGQALGEQPAKSLDDAAAEIMDALRRPNDALKAAQKYCLSRHRFTSPCSFKPTLGVKPGGDVVFARAEAFVPEGEAQEAVEAACADFADCFAREGLLGQRFDGFKSSDDLLGSTTWRLTPLGPEEYRRQMTETIEQFSQELAVLKARGDTDSARRLQGEIDSLQRDLDDHDP